MGHRCAPRAWQQTFDDCPYGRDFFSVTLPDHVKAERLHSQFPNASIQVDWLSTIFHQPPLFTWICFLYGYVPYLLMILNVFLLFGGKLDGRSDAGHRPSRRLSLRTINFLSFAVSITILNEVILKRIFVQQRPEYSCVTSCGMPSGHSTLSVGYFVLYFLDCAFRVYPQSDELQRLRMTTSERLCKPFRGLSWNKFKVTLFSLTPLAESHSVTHRQMICRTMFWMVVLLPVPLSRVAVGDHTPMQALAGSFLGALEASLWTLVTRKLQHHYRSQVAQDFCLPHREWESRNSPLNNVWLRLFNDFALPYFVWRRLDCNGPIEDIKKWYEAEDKFYGKYYIDRINHTADQIEGMVEAAETNIRSVSESPLALLEDPFDNQVEVIIMVQKVPLNPLKTNGVWITGLNGNLDARAESQVKCHEGRLQGVRSFFYRFRLHQEDISREMAYRFPNGFLFTSIDEDGQILQERCLPRQWDDSLTMHVSSCCWDYGSNDLNVGSHFVAVPPQDFSFLGSRQVIVPNGQRNKLQVAKILLVRSMWDANAINRFSVHRLKWTLIPDMSPELKDKLKGLEEELAKIKRVARQSKDEAPSDKSATPTRGLTC